MTNSQTLNDSIQKQFGQVAEHYRNSIVHAQGADLDALVNAAALTGTERVLDAGTGTGHTAIALAKYAGHVTAVDLTELMLEQGRELAHERGLTNIEFQRGNVEDLPFEDAAFDVVVSRYSAHHWAHPQAALQEFWRVLKPGGVFLLGDIVAPDDPTCDTFLQVLEVLRDPSHVRDHSVSQWQTLFEKAGFSAEVIYQWRLPLNFDSWVQRMATPPANVAMIKTLYDGAPAEVRAWLDIQPDYTFTIDGALVRGQK